MSLISLHSLLTAPATAKGLTGEQWNEVIRQARKAQLLGQLATRLSAHGILDAVPASVRRHLTLARLTSRRRSEAAEWEVGTLRRAMPPQVRMILLKGCAYLAARDANADGRLFSDIDLLVPRALLEQAEASLVADGWTPNRVNDYDQRFYRQWSHEIPPMEHVRRHTVLDLHHAIIPPISRYSFPVQPLFDSAEEIRPGVYVLSTVDRVIHCAVHLIQEGESTKVLRDLYDLFLLLEQHFTAPSARAALIERAEKFGVNRLVGTAIRATCLFFGSPPWPLGSYSGWLVRCLVAAATSGEAAVATPSAQVARIALLAHSHWMKMPLPMLIPHLCRKAYVGIFSREATPAI